MKVKLPLKAIDPMGEPGGLKRIGGSQSDIWNNLIVGQVVQTLWTKNSDPEERKRQYEGTISALIAISPRDEIEGMIATIQGDAQRLLKLALIFELRLAEGRLGQEGPKAQTRNGSKDRRSELAAGDERIHTKPVAEYRGAVHRMSSDVRCCVGGI